MYGEKVLDVFFEFLVWPMPHMTWDTGGGEGGYDLHCIHFWGAVMLSLFIQLFVFCDGGDIWMLSSHWVTLESQLRIHKIQPWS